MYGGKSSAGSVRTKYNMGRRFWALLTLGHAMQARLVASVVNCRSVGNKLLLFCLLYCISLYSDTCHCDIYIILFPRHGLLMEHTCC